jgi:hypothetical protein
MIIIKSRRTRLAEDVASSGKAKNAYKILVGKPEETRPLGGLGIKRRIILKCILKEERGNAWI